MKKALFLLLSLTFILISCSENPESYIKYINGYWEIKHVEKDNTLLKEFNISSNVDYFEVNEETLTGFRKKVTPTLEGKFIINKHESPFTLKIEGDELIINYNVNGNEYQETIKNASKEKMVITNTEGITYVYRPFISINLE
jgi:hypothetical protein